MLFKHEKDEAYEYLESGNIEEWNRFRGRYPDWTPNLKGLTLPKHLQDVDLTGVNGLSIKQLAGADLYGARLPEGWAFGLRPIEQASRNARGLFISLMLTCLYGWLTIGITTDVDLLTGGGATNLPFIGAKVSIEAFFLGAPLLIGGLFLYFHFYLGHLWELLAQLPATFPDGKTKVYRIYPWLLNGLVICNYQSRYP